MRKLYWRPQKISSNVLLLVALIAVIGMLSVEKFKLRTRLPFYQEKIRAAKLAQEAFDTIKEERLARGIAIDSESDPTETGMLGILSSPVTTNKGLLTAKQTAVDPNFAAVVVSYLKRVGVEKGDIVAVGMSGSFPAINISGDSGPGDPPSQASCHLKRRLFAVGGETSRSSYGRTWRPCWSRTRSSRPAH